MIAQTDNMNRLMQIKPWSWESHTTLLIRAKMFSVKNKAVTFSYFLNDCSLEGKEGCVKRKE